MTSTFIKSIQDSVMKPEMVQSAASALGENPENVTNALTALVPTLISKVTNTAATTEGSSSILDLAKNVYNSGILSNLGSFFGSDNTGITTTIFNSLLGGESTKWFDSIANFAGVKSSSAQALSGLVASSVLGSIGKHAADTNLSGEGLTSMLNGEKSFLSGILPAGITGILSGLGLGSFFGNLTDGVADTAGKVVDSVANVAKGTAGVVGDVADGAVDTAGKVVDGVADVAKETINVVGDAAKGAANVVGNAAEDVAEAGSSLMKWLLPLLLVGALILGGIFLFKRCSGDVVDAAKTGVNAVGDVANAGANAVGAAVDFTVDKAGNAVYALGELMDFELPGGIKIKAEANGTEKQLIDLIKAGTVSEDKAQGWINLYGVQFQQGNDVYATGKSDSLVSNVAAILKAYPKVKIKVGGYTSTEGDDNKNLALSQKRADKVLADLTAKGVPAAQLEKAEGYGEQFTVCDETKVAKDSTVALGKCRAQNRRVAVRVSEIAK